MGRKIILEMTVWLTGVLRAFCTNAQHPSKAWSAPPPRANNGDYACVVIHQAVGLTPTGHIRDSDRGWPGGHSHTRHRDLASAGLGAYPTRSPPQFREASPSSRV